MNVQLSAADCPLERRTERPGSLVTAVLNQQNQPECGTRRKESGSEQRLLPPPTWLCVHQALSNSACSFSLCSVSEARAIERIAANGNFPTGNPQSLHPNKKNPLKLCVNEQGNVRETIRAQKRLTEEVNSLSTQWYHMKLSAASKLKNKEGGGRGKDTLWISLHDLLRHNL